MVYPLCKFKMEPDPKDPINPTENSISTNIETQISVNIIVEEALTVVLLQTTWTTRKLENIDE